MKSEAHSILVAATKKSEANAALKKMDRPKAGFQTTSFDELMAALKQAMPDCLILLTDASGGLGKDLLASIQKWDDHLPVIILSPAKNIEQAVQYMKEGIYDFFNWPANPAKLKLAMQNACRMYRLTQRVFLLENQLGGQGKLDELIGTAAPMQTVFQIIRTVADTPATILLTGESGTGKELAAKALHRLSRRASRHFVDINCGAIPKELLENELFGHERGAYTGADRRYIGCCERANGGTLFLDEISEMDPSLQVKLLRFLQERHCLRVGGNEPIPVDVRIVAATNKNLEKGVAAGTFREDLFYRLNVVNIAIPPLRERKEDIDLLARHFLEKYAHKNEKPFLEFTQGAMETLLKYDWPGNVRELENTIERAVVLHHDTKIKRQHLPVPLQRVSVKTATEPAETVAEQLRPLKILPLNMVERYAIEQAFKACTGNVAKTAQRLKIGQATLYRKLKQYGIRV